MKGRHLNAAIALKKAEALAPLDERSRFTLVMAYVVLGHRDWARPELATLVATAPRNPLYVYWTGRLDYDDGQYQAAIRGFERTLELDPRFAKAHDNLGLCHEALGQHDEAIRSYQEAIRLNREQAAPSPWPPLNLGLLLTRLDRGRRGGGAVPRVDQVRRALPPGSLPARHGPRQEGTNRRRDDRARGRVAPRSDLSRAPVRALPPLQAQRRRGQGRPRARGLPAAQERKRPDRFGTLTSRPAWPCRRGAVR